MSDLKPEELAADLLTHADGGYTVTRWGGLQLTAEYVQAVRARRGTITPRERAFVAALIAARLQAGRFSSNARRASLDDVVDATEAAELLGVEPRTVRRRAREGRLVGTQLRGGGWVFDRQEIVRAALRRPAVEEVA